MKKRVYGVFGLGRFGMTLVKELSNNGQEVIAVDKDMAKVEEADKYAVSYAYDFMNIEALKNSGIGDIDVAIVASGENLEEAILLILNLKELNIPYIIAKAQNEKFGLALKKVGADEIVLPEMDMASRMALKLSSSAELIQLFKISEDILAYEIMAKQSWIGKNLIELDLRSNYSINVVGVRNNGVTLVNIDPKRPFEKEDVLLILSDEKSFKRLNKVK